MQEPEENRESQSFFESLQSIEFLFVTLKVILCNNILDIHI